MHKILLTSFLTLTMLSGWCNQNEKDSLQLLINNTIDLQESSNLSVELAWKNKYDDLTQSIEITKAALTDLEQLDDQNGIAVAKSYLGVYYYLENKIPEAVKNLKAAEKTFLKLNNTERLCRVYNNLGVVYGALYDNNSALYYYNKVLKIKDASSEEADISNNLINIATIHYDQGEYEKCIEINERALILTLRKRNYESTAVIYANLGAAHERLDHFSTSINYALKALDLYQNRVNNPLAEIRTYSNLGATYMSQNDEEEARHYFERAIELNKELQNAAQEAVLLNNMSELERKSNNLTKAKEIALAGLKLSNEIELNEEKLISLQTLSAIEDQLNNSKQALTYYKEYINLSDSLMKVSNYQNTQLALAQNQLAIDQINQEKEADTKLYFQKKTDVMIKFVWVQLAIVLIALVILIFRINIPHYLSQIISFLFSFLLAALSMMYVFIKTDLLDALGLNLFALLLSAIILIATVSHLGITKMFSKRN